MHGRRGRRGKTRKQRGGGPLKTVILYCYREDPEGKSNLEFFVRKGIVQDPAVTYVFTVNSGVCTVEIPEGPQVIVIKRQENAIDLATQLWTIKKLEAEKPEVLRDVQRVYMLNNSCRGPYVREGEPNWIEQLNARLADVEMLGPIVEFPSLANAYEPWGIKSTETPPFLHSYMLGMNAAGWATVLETLKKFPLDTKDQNIAMERNFSTAILLKGQRLGTLLGIFKGIDINNKAEWDPKKWMGLKGNSDPEVPGNYKGGELDPFEIMFVKNVRRVHSSRPAAFAGITPALQAKLDSLKGGRRRRGSRRGKRNTRKTR